MKKRTLLPLSLVVSAIAMAITFQNCSGGGGGGAGASLATVIKGVAASGAAIQGALVTIKDSAGNTMTVTTGSDGSFQFSPAGLTPPCILSVSNGGTTLFSYAGSSSAVANLNPYTAVIMQAYYAAQGTDAATVFSGTLTLSSFPSSSQLAMLTTPIVSSLQGYLSNASVSNVSSFSPFESAFTANGSGFDQVLDRTVVDPGLLSFSVDNGSGSSPGATSSTVTLTVNAGGGSTLASVAINSSTTNGGVTSSSQASVPVGSTTQQSDLAAAEAGVILLFKNLAQLAVTKGAGLAASDILPYIDVGYLDQGKTQSDFASELANGLTSSGIVSGSIQFYRINSFIDGSTKLLAATLIITQADSTTSFLDDNDNVNSGMVFKQQADGSWAFYGQQTATNAHIGLQQSKNYTKASSTSTNFLSMQAQIGVPTNFLTGASVTGPTNSLTDCAGNPSPLDVSSVNLVKDAGSFDGGDRYDLACSSTNGGAISGTLPPAGTLYTFHITPTAGSPSTQTYVLNSSTNDNGDLITINGSPRATFMGSHTSAASVAGMTLTLTFTPPTTYPILYSYISIFCENAAEVAGGGGTDIHGNAQNLAPGTTSGTVTIPTQCDGAAVAGLDVNVWFVGVNGETSFVNQIF